LSELRDAESRNGCPVHQVRVQPEGGLCPEVQRHDAHDECAVGARGSGAPRRCACGTACCAACCARSSGQARIQGHHADGRCAPSPSRSGGSAAAGRCSGSRRAAVWRAAARATAAGRFWWPAARTAACFRRPAARTAACFRWPAARTAACVRWPACRGASGRRRSQPAGRHHGCWQRRLPASCRCAASLRRTAPRLRWPAPGRASWLRWPASGCAWLRWPAPGRASWLWRPASGCASWLWRPAPGRASWLRWPAA
jgi:hypothetical protein